MLKVTQNHKRVIVGLDDGILSVETSKAVVRNVLHEKILNKEKLKLIADVRYLFGVGLIDAKNFVGLIYKDK